MASKDESDDVRKAIENRGLGRAARTLRTLELRTLGFSYPDIVSKMKEESYRISESTVRRDLHSLGAIAFRDEVLRRQLMDIAISGDAALRLKARAHILDKLYPRIVYAGKLKDASKEELKLDESELGERLRAYLPVIAELLAEETGIGGFGLGEQVHPEAPPSGDGAQRTAAEADEVSPA